MLNILHLNRAKQAVLRPILRTAYLCILLFISSCAVYNTDYDKQLGAQNAQQVAAQMGLYQPETLSQYVKSVGQRLVDALDSPEFTFQFEIVDDATPNAFALPGGYIYISRGLLALMLTEDELANVLAHEIIHVTERHSIKQMRSGVLPSLIELPGNIIGVFNENLGSIINTPISAGNDLLLSGYSRSHESESDEKGAALAAKAGYQPAEMAHILTRLNQSVELLTNQKQQKSYFDSHPFTEDRVAHLQSVVSGLTISPTKHINDNFIAALDGLTYGDNPQKGIFIKQQFLHPEMQFVIDFPAQWTLLNQPQAVIAIEQSQQSLVALTLAENNNNALQNAQEFKHLVKQEAGEDIDYKQITLAWGGEAYLVSFPDIRQGTPTTVQLMWVDLYGKTYQITSMGSDQYQQQVTLSMQSFRPLSDSDKNAISTQVLRIVKAEEDDSLNTLSKRENNIGEINYVSLINEIEAQQRLLEEQEIKIITEEPYEFQ